MNAFNVLLFAKRVVNSFYSWSRSASMFDDNSNGIGTVTLTLQTNGTVTATTSTGDSASLANDFAAWHDAGTVTGIGNSRWAKKTTVSGTPTTGTLAPTLTALSATRTITMSMAAGEPTTGVTLIEIYSDAGGTTKVGEISLTLSAG